MLQNVKKALLQKKVAKEKVKWMTKEMAEDYDREAYLSTTARETIIFIVFLINLTIVRNNSCTIHPHFKRTFLECFNAYSSRSIDNSSFGLKTGSAWTYSAFTRSIVMAGRVATYHSGGFMEKLSNQSKESLKILKNLKDNLWITRGTRAVFIDFTTYNPNVNLCCVVKLMFEFPPTGGVIPTAYFYTLKVIRYATLADYLILACEMLHIGFAIFYFAEEIREIIFDKWKYFKRFWSYIDQSIIWTSVIYTLMSIRKYWAVMMILKEVQKERNEYHSFFRLALFEVDTRNYLAITLFLAYMKIFKYLSFNKTMSQLNDTLKKCAKDVASFSVMFLLIFVSFAQLGYLIFGSQVIQADAAFDKFPFIILYIIITKVSEFSGFGTAMFTLLRTILGDFDYSEIEKAHRVLAPLYFLLFIFLVFFVLLNMFLAIINDTYTEVKTEMAIAPDQMQMAEFMKRGYYNFLRKCGCGRFVHQIKVMRNEYNATMEQIRGVLKRCGFTDMDVDMFFSKYNIDPNAQIDQQEMSRLIQNLLGSVDDKTPGTTTTRTAEGAPLVAIEDFVAQQERLDNIEKVLAQIAEKLDKLLQKLKKLDTKK